MTSDSKLKITLVRSSIGTLPKQKHTVKALGLGKIGSTVIQKNNDSTLGMINKVKHLVKVEEFKEV